MYFGILFNSCFSLFSSVIEITMQEIHFNKFINNFLQILNTSQFM